MNQVDDKWERFCEVEAKAQRWNAVTKVIAPLSMALLMICMLLIVILGLVFDSSWWQIAYLFFAGYVLLCLLLRYLNSSVDRWLSEARQLQIEIDAERQEEPT